MRAHKYGNRKESNSQQVTKLNLMIIHYFVDVYLFFIATSK